MSIHHIASVGGLGRARSSWAVEMSVHRSSSVDPTQCFQKGNWVNLGSSRKVEVQWRGFWKRSKCDGLGPLSGGKRSTIHPITGQGLQFFKKSVPLHFEVRGG